MFNLTKLIIVLVFFAFFLTELNVIALEIWPEIDDIEVDLFWSPYYKQEISVQYYIHEFCSIMKDCIIFFVCGQVCLRYSFKLFTLCFIFFWYYFLQIFFYWWDRNTSFERNGMAYVMMALIILFYFKREKQVSRYISLD